MAKKATKELVTIGVYNGIASRRGLTRDDVDRLVNIHNKESLTNDWGFAGMELQSFNNECNGIATKYAGGANIPVADMKAADTVTKRVNVCWKYAQGGSA